jgi:hypothetical protein
MRVDHGIAIAAQIAPTEVVGNDDEYVGSCGWLRLFSTASGASSRAVRSVRVFLIFNRAGVVALLMLLVHEILRSC